MTTEYLDETFYNEFMFIVDIDYYIISNFAPISVVITMLQISKNLNILTKSTPTYKLLTKIISKGHAMYSYCIKRKENDMFCKLSTDMTINNYNFLTACSSNNTCLAKWIYHMGLKLNVKITTNSEIFEHVCENGYIEIARLLRFINDDYNYNCYNYNVIFIKVCVKGHLNMAQWIYSLEKLLHSTIKHAFKMACKYGKLDVAKWLWMLEPKFLCDALYQAFVKSCKMANVNTTKWLLSLCDERSTSEEKYNIHDNIMIYKLLSCVSLGKLKFTSFDMTKWIIKTCEQYDQPSKYFANNKNIFINFCNSGLLDQMKWLWEYIYDDAIKLKIVECHKHECLQIACTKGYFDVFKWLWNTCIHKNFASNMYPKLHTFFELSCVIGHIDIAKWIFYKSLEVCEYINIYDVYKLILTKSCQKSIKATKWVTTILSYCDIDGDVLYDMMCYAFTYMIICGSIDVASWLWDYYDERGKQLNIHFYDDFAFAFATSKGKHDASKWIYDKSIQMNSPIDIRSHNDLAFRKCCYDNNKYMAIWLMHKYNGYKLAYSRGCIYRFAIDDEWYRC